MYTPKHNQEEDRAKLYDFMRAYSFATLVTLRDNAPQATHLPFMMEASGESCVLLAHMARANPQWRDFDDAHEALVIFQEPHGYVSPRHYETALNVPTWNYIAVHAYGQPRILEADAEKLGLLESMIREHDEGYFQQWRELPEAYIARQLQGIVAFQMDVVRLEARFKLSQDRTQQERERIIQEFTAQDDSTRSELGELMRSGS